MNITRTATVEWNGDLATGSGSIFSESGTLHDTGLTYPRRIGETDGHTTPEELLAAAHAGCYSMSLAGTLTRDKTPPTRLEVVAEVTLERGSSGFRITGSVLRIRATVPGATLETFEDAARRADQTCPISSVLRAGSIVELDAELVHDNA